MSATVTVEYAPLVYGRTAYIDFRPDFLAAPAAMSASDRQTAKTFVQAATDYADRLDRDGPRWVMFKAGDWLVAGVVAESPTLSQKFLHERKLMPDGSERPQRLLFAFSGAAFRTSAPVAPPRDIAFYARIYDSTVGPRFEERKASSPGWQDATGYPLQSVELPAATSPAPPAVKANMVEIWPHDDAQLEDLWAASAAGHGRPSLCTNAPPGKFKQVLTFDRISRQDVTGAPVTQTREPPREIASSSLRKTQVADSMRPDAFVGSSSQKKKSESTSGSVPIALVVAGGLAILVTALLLLRPR